MAHKAQKNKKNNKQTKKRVRVPRDTFRPNGPSGYKLNQSSQQMVQVRGHETMGLVSATDADGKVRLAACYDLNPACWRNSRLQGIARAYERYRYNSFRVHYIPRAAKTTTGVVSLSCEFDPTDDLLTGEPGLVSASQHAVFAQGPTYDAISAAWRRPTEDKAWYLASYDDSFDNALATSQGRVYSLAGANVAGTLGTLVLEYDIEFYMPELEAGLTGNQFINGSAVDATVRAPNATFNFVPNGINPDSVGVIRFIISKLTDGTTEMDSYTLQKGTTGSSNTTTLVPGREIALAWNNATGVWNAYEDVLEAASLTGPFAVKTGAASTKLSLFGYGKELNI